MAHFSSPRLPTARSELEVPDNPAANNADLALTPLCGVVYNALMPTHANRATPRLPRLLLAPALLAISGLLLGGAPATQPANDGSLRVDGDVETPITLDAAAIAAMPHVDLPFKPHHGDPAAYSGVPLADVLLKAGVPLGKERLRGAQLSRYVLVVGADGYKALFALPEFDADYRQRQILLADRKDGHPLDPKEGPLRLIVADEAMQARDVRQVVELRLGRANP